MAPRFLTQAWLDEGRRAAAASPAFRKAVHGLTTKLLTEITDAPDGKTRYVLYAFEDGDLVRTEIGTKSTLGRLAAEFRITGKYDTFARLQQGTLTLPSAYFRRLVKIHGNQARALRFAPAFLAYNQAVRRVPTEY